ncbi:MAG: hypothetical protein WBV83_25595 [Bradyrhizobium sp.]
MSDSSIVRDLNRGDQPNDPFAPLQSDPEAGRPPGLIEPAAD